MTTYSMDVELFISVVKKYPEIWNNQIEDSRSPARRHQAWTEIARIFIEEFDDLCELEKHDVYKKLQNKWRNIRDSYVRHKRKKYEGKKGYLYAKQLSFLEDLYKASQSGSENEATQNDADDWPSDADDDKLKKLFKTEFSVKEEPIIDWSGEPVEKKRKKGPNKRETQIDFVETSFQEASCSYNEDDEDKSFFFSLLPAIKDFDIDKKLEFRSEILKLVKRYRKEERPRHLDDSE